MKIKIFTVAAIIILLSTIILPNISGFQIKKDENNFLTLNAQVYNSSPDWISDNPHYSTGAAFADFNNDGWLDFIVADGNDILLGRVNVYYNTGDGEFPTTADWQSDDLAYNGHLDVADVNGDGWPDVAVSYLGTSDSVGPIARLYLNNEGTLSSSPDWTANVIGNAFGVDFGDMNNDGRPDLAVATGWAYTPTEYRNYVYLNNGGSLEASASWYSGDNDVAQGCLWLDADNDSWLDLVCICMDEETKIYHNLGGDLESIASWETSDSSNQDGIMLTHGDVNSDGLPDLFATDNNQLGGSGRFKQYDGLSEGFFETTYSWNYFEGYGSAIALADVNGDKKLDLATGGWWDNTRIFINEGSGLPNSPTWNSGGTSVVEKIVFGNIGPEHCEHTFIKNFNPDGDRQLFHLPHQPIQRIINISLDGDLLDPSEYTYSREHGWITVNSAPTESLEVAYNYSNSLDMAVSNWDGSIGNYLYYNQLSFADLECEGNLSWIDVEPGETVEGSFTVENIGTPLTLLNWEIESYPDWGDWLITPQNGFNLTPEDGPIIVNVEVIAPLEGGNEFEGEIKVINKDDPEDYDTIPVSLKLKTVTEPAFRILSISGGTGVKIEFENSGDAPATNVDWNIKVTGGILNLINVNKEDVIPIINPEEKKSINSGMFLGFGPINIQFTLNCDEGVSEHGSAKGRQILIFTLL